MKDKPIFEIAAMVVFGLLGVFSFIAGLCGNAHQLMLAEIDAIIFIVAYISYYNKKK